MPDESKEDFGRWLLSLRTRAGLTQSQLAGRIGVDYQRILNWEKGNHLPSAQYLVALFDACGVRLEAVDPPPAPPAQTAQEPETREDLLTAVQALAEQIAVLATAAERLADRGQPNDVEPALDDEVAS